MAQQYNPLVGKPVSVARANEVLATVAELLVDVSLPSAIDAALGQDKPGSAPWRA